MADDQIKIQIGLEGDAEIKKKFDAIKDAGKKTGAELSKSLNELVSTGKLGSAIGAEENLERSRVAAERFREVIHTLHPILDTAELGLGNLGALARVAGAGMGALAAAIVGSVVVGLGKLADQTAATKKQLDDLSQGKGASHFAGLQQDAKRLGTDVENLVPAYKQALGLRNDLNAANRSVKYAPGVEPFNLPGGPLSNENLHAATSAVQSFFTAGKADDPGKANADFFTELRESRGASDAGGAAGRCRCIRGRCRQDRPIAAGGLCVLSAGD